MNTINILIADDIEAWVAFHKNNLSRIFDGKEIVLHSFNSANDAYNFALGFKEKIDFVITDLEMESMNKLAGEWLIENLKSINSTKLSKFFIISGSYNIKFVAERVDADGFLRKSSYQANPDTLKFLLEEALLC